MCVCAGIAHAGASSVRRGGAEGQKQGVQAARGVREAAHVRLGATMASELAEKRSAIAWVGSSAGRDVCEGTVHRHGYGNFR